MRQIESTFNVFNKVGLKSLLIGGYACVIYGAKTSTADLDIYIDTEPGNLKNLKSALEKLKLKPSPLSVPIDSELINKGHSLHYYFENRFRLDILGYLPRVSNFQTLWSRQFAYDSPSGVLIPVIDLKDLVNSKKTGRLKDAADISALVKSHYLSHKLNPGEEDIRFWLLEAREADFLIGLADKYARIAKRLAETDRRCLKYALKADFGNLRAQLLEEASNEGQVHEEFRGPLRTEAKELARKGRK